MKPTWIRDVIDLLAVHLPEPLARAIVAVALIAVGLVVAWGLGWLVGRLLRRVTERVIRFMGTPLDDDESQRTAAPEAGLESTAVRVVDRVVFWLVLAFFVGGATSLLGFPIIGAWLSGLAGYLPRVLAAAAVVLLGVLSARLLRVITAVALRRAGFAQAELFSRVVQVAVILVAAVVAIEELGIGVTFFIVIATTVLAAVLGAGALAFGLGARDTVRNLVAAHYASRNLRVGHRVRIGKHEGEIIEIGATSIALETADGQVLLPARLFQERPCVLLGGDEQ